MMFTTIAAAAAISTVASLTPQRLYYGVDRPMPVAVAEGENRELVLLKPDNAEVARGAVPDGASEIDAAQIIPNLYSYTTVHYLQLLIDGEPTGPAVVLQPMVRRPRPVLRMGEGSPSVENWPTVPARDLAMSGFRVYVERYPVLRTTKGDITLVMRPDHAPNTVWNFLHLVEGGYYTDVIFHRVVPRLATGHPFVIQAGDPTGTGSGGPGFRVALEPSTLPHDLGVISMAREGSDVDTAGSQFFLCLSREGTSFLDVQYTSFGQTLEGIDVIQKIGAVEIGAQDRPVDPPVITRAELIDANPRTPGDTPTWMKPQDRAATQPAEPVRR